MLEHTIKQIEQTKKSFQKQSYPYKTIDIAGRSINYYVVPQTLNEDLPDFVIRISNNEAYVIGISNSVPEQLQPYFVLEEYIEFMEKGIEKENCVIEAEQEVIAIIPQTFKKDYLKKRIALFTKELILDKKQPDKYALGTKGRQEFENNLTYLKAELAKNQ
ncbi:hypothetical protein GF367_01070 [Candidatus Woesearchaeota archaeon]|nr:hypothetical protein [Candidatus Woesearchaeota archaeon]